MTLSSLIVVLCLLTILVPKISALTFFALVIFSMMNIVMKPRLRNGDYICILLIFLITIKQFVFFIYLSQIDYSSFFKYSSVPVLLMSGQRLLLKKIDIKLINFSLHIMIITGVCQYTLDALNILKMPEITATGTTSSSNISMIVILNLVFVILASGGLQNLREKILLLNTLVFKSAAVFPILFYSIFVAISKYKKVLFIFLIFLSIYLALPRVRFEILDQSQISGLIKFLRGHDGVGLGSFFWRVWAWLYYFDQTDIWDYVHGLNFGSTSWASHLFMFENVKRDPHNSFIIVLLEYGGIIGFLIIYSVWYLGYRPVFYKLGSSYVLSFLLVIAFGFGNAASSKEFISTLTLLVGININLLHLRQSR